MSYSKTENCRPTRAIIDLRALRYNLNQIRSLLPPEVKILAVVKADAYGHGATEVARECIASGAAVLGVALVEEGVTLRSAGIRTPILVQCCVSEGEIEIALQNELMLTAASLRFARAVSDIAVRLKRQAVLHVDIDTGMGRIGFQPKTAVNEIGELLRLPCLSIDGVYTHFCTAEIENDMETLRQLELFENVVQELALLGVKPSHVHTANSGAILNHPKCYFTLVRPGLILYGVYPHNNLRGRLDLRPVLTFETAVSFLKEIHAGTTLGYGRTFTAQHDMKIATLNVGYADGYLWRLSNRASVLVRGQRAPVVGRVSMDQTLIDVTGIAGVEIGEKVVLLGQNGSEKITAEDLADWASTIPYEILCGISKRVPRVYVT